MTVFRQVAQIVDLRGGQSVVGTFLVTLKELHKSNHRFQQRLFGEGNKIIDLIVIIALIYYLKAVVLFSLFNATQTLSIASKKTWDEVLRLSQYRYCAQLHAKFFIKPLFSVEIKCYNIKNIQIVVKSTTAKTKRNDVG